MANISKPNHPQPDHGETVRDETISDDMLARRRLLKLGVYVPPAVLGMMIVGGMPTQAVAGSCCPVACNPCTKLGGNTNPEKCKEHWRRCKHAQRKLRRKGIQCPPLPYPCRHGHHGGGEGGGEGGEHD